MGRLRPGNRQRTRISPRIRVVIGASVFLFAFSVVFVYIKLSEIEETHAFVEGDYRTVDSGNWDDESIWEQYNGQDWYPALESPSSRTSVIVIDSGHVVIMEEEIIASRFIIRKGAKVELFSNSIRIEKTRGEGYLMCEGMLDFGDCIVEGNGDFSSGPGSAVCFGNPYGLDRTAGRGNLQLKGKISFDDETTYVFNGTELQETGSGFPAEVNTIRVSNPEGLLLSSNLLVSKELILESGVIFTEDKHLVTGTRPEQAGMIRIVDGAVCGILKRMTNFSTENEIEFPMSDGHGSSTIIMQLKDKGLKDGYLVVKYYKGSIMQDSRSPFEATERVIGISGDGFFTASGNQGLKDASFVPEGVKADDSGQWISRWALVSYRNIKSGKKGREETIFDDNGNLTDIIVGPNPCTGIFFLRFRAEYDTSVMLDIIDAKGKSVYRTTISAASGYTNWKYNSTVELGPGLYFLRLSTTDEIKSIPLNVEMPG